MNAVFDELKRVCEKLAASEAECAEMRKVLENIWDRDELGKPGDPEDQSGCSVCPECEAHLPHGGHAKDCITGQISHALSTDCGKGWRSPEDYAALEAKCEKLRALASKLAGFVPCSMGTTDLLDEIQEVLHPSCTALGMFPDLGKGFISVKELERWVRQRLAGIIPDKQMQALVNSAVKEFEAYENRS